MHRIRAGLADGRQPARLQFVTAIPSAFPRFSGPVVALLMRLAAADAGNGPWVYVQNSLCVTKVLIRKRFRLLARRQELTNLET